MTRLREWAMTRSADVLLRRASFLIPTSPHRPFARSPLLSSPRLSSSRGLRAAHVLTYEFDDVVHPRARGEHFGHSKLFQSRNVFVRDDSPPEDDHVIEPLFARKLDDWREERHMRS